MERYVNHDGADILRGYRGACYMGIGMAGAGMIVATLYVARDFRLHGIVKKGRS